MTNPTPRSFKSRLFRSMNPRLSKLEDEVRTERERINLLETELAELRHDSLRIAELTDLIEDRLTPQTRKQ